MYNLKYNYIFLKIQASHTNNTTTTSSATGQNANGSTSKHLEQLNSVREALFSQDGWGGSNVKQDNAWTDLGGGSASGPSGQVSIIIFLKHSNSLLREKKNLYFL